MRRNLTRVILALAAIVSPGALTAQETVSSPLTWTRHTLQSSVLGAERAYRVALPASYAGDSQQRYPVLVILDADDEPQFLAALANARFLGLRAEIPELIIVGVPNAEGMRTRDLSPAPNEAMARMFPDAGGADRFLAFLGDELLPAVRSAYRALPATFLAGHSFGGLFGVHAAATRPDLFAGTIAMSPALQWNDSEAVTQYADLLAKRTTPHRLFVTSAPFEPPIDTATLRFIARFDSVDGSPVALGHARYSDDHHGLTPLRSFIDGLRFLFQPISLTAANAVDPMPMDSAQFVAHASAMERQYAAGARSLGLPETIPEPVLNQWGYTALQRPGQPLPGAAVAIFRRNAALYPESANVYDSLGDGLLAAGDTVGARAQFAKAVALARVSGHPVLATSERKLAELK